MKKDSRVNRHFGIRQPHTEIKHNIFQEAFTRSLSIANILSRGRDTYTYIDLYSGRGTFEDGSLGSPLIAINSAVRIINNPPPALLFKKIQCILIDKERENIDALLRQLDEQQSGSNKLSILSGCGEWETFSNEIRNHLLESRWGFIFADPFSTELDLTKFKNLISTACQFKDILVFVNFNTLARQHGRGHASDIERVCNSLGITENELYKSKFTETFKAAIQSNFAGFGKDFILSAAIPIVVEGKIRNCDYFYLILSTGSTGVADAFLAEYSRNIKIYREKLLPQTLSLFPGDPETPYDYILSILRMRREISLYELLKHLYNDFFSWKKADVAKIPTSSNVKNAINELSTMNKIVIDVPERFYYKSNNKKMKLDIFRKKEYLQAGRAKLI